MFVSKKVKVSSNGKGKALYVIDDIPQGECILEFSREYVNSPSRYTLRIDEDKHLINANPEAEENFINHSCEPNACIDFEELSLKSMRPIKSGEEITYHYLTADWDNEDSFTCRCGSPNCLHNIKGFKHLSPKDRKKIFHLVSPFIRKKSLEKL
ncbi:MAG TPA: SET domain-containing protein [Candidatus Nanoarchaeia archaeon]|nr:SET domain-containing protein [Candidatus Nanoarchaeia archaeon]